MKVTLIIKHKKKQQNLDLQVNKPIVIGRSSSSDYKIEDEKISSSHCRLHLKQNKLEVFDLDSKNGTYLNGIRIEQADVFMGDEILVGETLITLEERSSDDEALEFLTFPGPVKDRVNYELKADFTGARIQNQKANRHLSVVPKIKINESHAKEIELRKKARSPITLSKEELIARYPNEGLIAKIIDMLVIMILFTIPFIVISKIFPFKMPKDLKSSYLLIMEAFLLGIFILANYKFSKFTVGERISGIKKRYKNQ